MSSIKHYIANAHGQFDSEMLSKIEKGLNNAKVIIEKKLKADKIDVIFASAAKNIIPEIGIGGYSPGPYSIFISLDPKFKKFLDEDLVLTIAHEAHHCMRYRKPGYGKTLGEAMTSEGLATLFEEEISGKPPIYARVKLKKEEIEQANKYLDDSNYVHSDWFFGSKNIQRWFGYTYGYKLSKAYSEKTGKKASELVHSEAKLMFPT